MDQELAAFRKTAAAIIGAKRKGDQQQFEQLATEGLLEILKIKEANKRLCARVEVAKEQTSNAKLSLENADSTLQNLLYEKSYYEKEIHTCRSFVSKVKDEDVALMPVDQFRASLGSTPEDEATRAKADSSEHELMKARLIHENALRKSLVKQLEELKQEKQALSEGVGAQQKVLSELQTRLKTVEGTAKPLQTVLGPTVHLKGSVSRAAEMLPTPLYIAYSQLVAAGEALQMGCSVSILGSTDEAESFARSLVPDAAAADDGHPNNISLQPASLEDLYKPHPLSVELHVHRDASPSPTVIKPPTILMSVILQYLPALKVVTAHCKDPADNAVLRSLFPSDDGSGMPIEALAQLQAGHFRFSSSRVARPYRWCQHLAGLDFVPTMPQLAVQLQPGEQLETVLSGLEVYRKQQRVAAVVARLRQAKMSENCLNGHIATAWMLHNYLPIDTSMYSGRPTSVVLAWEQVSSAAAPGPPDTPASFKTPRARVMAPGAGVRQPALAGAVAGAGESEGLDDGELPPQQPLAGGTAEGAAGGGEAGTPGLDSNHDATLEGDTMAWEAQQEEEEGALPDESPPDNDGDLQQQQSRRDHRGRSAAITLLLEQQEEEMELVAGSAARRRPRPPPSRRFRLIARSRVLELEASVWLFTEYPMRAPLFRVKALRVLPGAAADALAVALKGRDPAKTLPPVLTVAAGEPLGPAGANHVAWIEQQVNVDALALVPKTRLNETLFYQVTHLRFALDSVSKAHELSNSQALVQAGRAGPQREADDVCALHARQQLAGRARHPSAPGQACKPVRLQ